MHTVSPKHKTYDALTPDVVDEILNECEQFPSIEAKRQRVEEHWGYSLEYFDAKKTYCIHCDKIVDPQEFKFYRGSIWCPNFPICDGTVIDWCPISWYDQYHSTP